MRGGYLNAAGVVGVLVVAAIAAASSFTAALAIVLLFLCAAAAYNRPSAALVAAPMAVALIPIYWAPDLPGTNVGLSPIVVVCGVLMPVALTYRDAFRMSPIDRLMLLFVGLMVVGYVLNASGALGSILAAVFATALPYVTFRLLGLRAGASHSVAVGVVLSGVVSAYIAIREYNGWPNPFFDYFTNGHQHAFFIRVDNRLGHARPEAAFGHAIALGMFLVLAAVLALGLAWRRRDDSHFPRPLLYASALLIVFALVNNLVRGPLLMLGFAVLVMVLSESRSGRHSRGVLVAVALVVLVNIGSFANVFQLREATFQQGGRVQQSAEYRAVIWRVVADGQNFSLLGRKVVDDAGVGFVEAVGHNVGIRSFDNGFALIYIGFGALALLIFVLIGLRIAHAALFANLGIIDRAWAATVLAAFINLMTVNLLTQFSHIFWMAIGLIASALQLAHERDAEEPSATPALASGV